MCLTCGCGRPDDNMGNPDNIITETLRRAAKAAGAKNIKQVMETLNKTYRDKVKGKPVETQPIA